MSSGPAPEPKQLPKPVDWQELYPGRFLKAADFKGQRVTLTISAVNLEELIGDKGAQVKGVITFERTEKMWALNKTNGTCLKAMFGKKVQTWVGKRVTLFPTQVKMPTGEMDDAIRVYGSPEIENDMEISISLPRRRPVSMTMHRTSSAPAPGHAHTPPASSSTAPKQQHQPDVGTWRATLAGSGNLAELEDAWKACCAAFTNHPPIELDDAHQNRREQLAEAAARQ